VAIIRKIRSLFLGFRGLGLAAHFMMARRDRVEEPHWRRLTGKMFRKL